LAKAKAEWIACSSVVENDGTFLCSCFQGRGREKTPDPTVAS
jgi:hypothetical protein